MSKTIVERVVQMRFDNSQFEKNVSTSMSTLDKLKQKLNLEGASKGLENVSAATKNFSLAPLTNGIESVKVKFSAFEVMAVTALGNITNSAVNAGKQLVKSLSVDQISAGWQKFGSKTTSVATLVAQGNDLKTVNEQLDRLNWFTDETSYNFTDMVSNIAKFTATGKGLDESVTAMEGIATWAALSGQNAQTASNAMYQLSQAMGAGVMRMEDYKSIQNASMDTDEFRQKCLDAGVALGTLKKNADGTYKSLKGGKEAFEKSQFAQHLTEDAWLTSDVMMKVFNDYSSAVSGIYEAAEEKGMLASEVIDEIHDKAKKEGISTDEAIKSLGYNFDSFALKAFEAAQKARTFGDAIDSVKDAVSTGWMNTFEIIFGNAEEATELWTDLANAMYDVFAAGGEARNEMLKGWKELGGRDDLIASFWNVWEGISSIVTPIKEAFRDIFPATTAEKLAKITANIKEFTSKLKLSESASEKLKSTFRGLFAVIDIGWTFIKKLAGGIVKLLGNFKSFGGGILDTTASIGDWLVNLRDSIKETDIFGKVINGTVDFISKAISKIKEFSSAIGDWVGNLKRTIQESDLWGQRIAKITKFLNKAKEGVRDFFSKFGEKIAAPGLDTLITVLGAVWKLVKKVGAAVGKFAKKIGTAFTEAFRSGDLKGGIDLLNGGIFATILLGIKKFISGLKDTVGSAGGFLDSIKGILDGVKGSLEAWQQSLKADTLKKIAVAIAILAGSLLIMSLIDPEKLSASLGGITVLFANLMGSMAIFDKLGGKGGKGVAGAATSLIKIAAAVLILSYALKNISTLSWEELGKGLVGVTVLLGEVVAASILLSKYGNKVKRCGLQMILIAAALKIFVSVCEGLSKLSWEELAKGVSGIGVILLEFVGFQALMKLIKPKKMLSSALALVIIGAAMEIFANVCAKFGKMEWVDLGKAGAAIGGILLLASGFALLSGLSKKMLKSSVALVIIGAAMEIFADVCKKFGQMKWEELGKAGAAIGGVLVLAAGFMLLAGLSKKMLRSVIALTIISAAMEIFADVCKKFGQMEWGDLGKAGAAIGGILALCAGFALLAGLSSGMLKSAAALVVMAIALAMLTPVLKALGGMSWGEVVKGLVAIAGVFAIIGVAGLLLGPVVPVILALAGAIALLGLACLAVGVGLLAFSVAFTALSTATAAGATAVVAALGVIIIGILDLIPAIIDELTKALVALCQVVIQGAPAIAEAIIAVILAALDLLVECVPQIASGLLQVLLGVLDALVEYGPQIVSKLYDFLIGVIEATAEKLPGLIQAGVNLIMAFFQGIVDALSGIDTETLLKGIVGVGLLSAMMLALSAVAALVPGAMIGVLGMGAVIAELALVLAAVGGLAQIPGLEWLISEGGDFLQKIGTAIGQFIGGIVGGIAQGITASLPQIATDLSNFMTNLQPFLDGAKSIDASIIDNVTSLAGAIIALTGANLLEGITSWITGGSSMTKFANDLVPFGKAIKDFSVEVDGIDGDTVTSAANAGKVLAEMAKSLPREGGWWDKIAGGRDISGFGDKIVSFGKSIKNFANEVDGIKGDSVTSAANAGQVLAEMAKSLPREGGWWDKIAGSKDLESFGSKIVKFGSAIKSFAAEVEGIKPDSVTNAANAGKVLTEMADTLPREGGLWSKIAGSKDLESFGTKITKFAEGIKSFAAEASGISTDSVSKAALAIKKIVEIVKMTSDLDTSGLSSFGSSLGKLGKSGVDNFIKAFSSSEGKAANVGKILVSNVSKGVRSGLPALNKSLIPMVQNMLKAIQSKASAFMSAGRNLAVRFSAGIRSGSSATKTAFSTALSGAVSNARSYYNSFYGAGSYVAQGFANGIKDNRYKAEAQARIMAQNAATAAKKALDINSPSKVFRAIAYSIPEGFAQGIDRMSWMATDSVKSMANDTISGMSGAIARVAAVVNDGMDDQLTIRPVLDLTDVTAGANRMNSLFNTNPSVGLLSNVRSVSSMMNRNQNGANGDIISAIKDLGKTIGSTSGDTYSINGITYDDGSNVSEAVRALARAVRIERRT